MADSETEEFGDLSLPSSKILSLETELQETRHHLDCVVGKLAEAESHCGRLQCENELLQRQVALLKKELAAYKDGKIMQAVNGPQGDLNLQCKPTDGTHDVSSTDGACLPDWTTDTQDATQVDIGESLKATAEAALGLSGFVYDEASGLYYDYKLQYYYDPVSCLYYEPHSGTYYSFNQDTHTYEFHSQVDVEQLCGGHIQHPKGGRAGRKKRHREKRSSKEDHYEDQAHLSELTKALSTLRLGQQAREVSSGWPPCVRVMVKNSPHLQVGTLYIVTCSGATIGREKELGHTVLIPDTQVSKMHCDIQYDGDLQKYVVRDHASQNGTLLNGHRISQPKKMSAALPLSHLDILQVGDTQLDLHIHPGTETCDSCEPGQVMAQQQLLEQQATTESIPVQTKAQREQLRRQQLKMIKKKFGLADCAYVDNVSAVKNHSYEDKASIRRQTVGSDHPYQKDDLPASVTRAIPTENKGHKLLAKMGWKEGEGLGKANAGIQQPIQVDFRCDQTAGLGASGNKWSVDDVSKAQSTQKWIKARQRFNRLDGKKHHNPVLVLLVILC